ncbi:MAG TPA: VWA domain-containing protein [Candidatus Angelobacter sp.]|nr:VWA domain-containing protein [Candidatus Angelobacter sp.]
MPTNVAVVRLAVVLVVLGTFNLIAQESKDSAGQGKPAPGSQQSSSAVPSQSLPHREKASQAAPPLPGPSLKVTSRMVLVDAVVTDKAGKPVSGLKASDFEILENGKPQAIRAFGAREPASKEALPPASKVLPSGLFTNIPDFRPEDGPPTVVLIDALNTSIQDQPYMRNQLVKYLKGVGSRHNVAVYILSSRLRLLQDFTSDPQVLQSVVAKMELHSSLLTDTSEGEMGALSDNVAGAIQDFNAEQEAFKMDMRVRITMDALKLISRNVSGYPGRKNLIWLSGSFPLYIAPDTDLSNPFLSQRQYADQIHDAANILTDSQIAVYPVDARGLVGNLMPDASSHGFTSGRQTMKRISDASANLQGSHDAMNSLADQTGGRAFYNRNDIDQAINLSVEDGSTYYSFGYYPDDKNWNGKFRKIEVKILNKDLRIRHRRGYFAVDTSASVDTGTKEARSEFGSALALESPMVTMLPFAAQVSMPTATEPDVIVNFGVDPRAISFDLQADHLRHAKVDFVILAFDGKGKVVASKTDTLTASLRPDTFDAVMTSHLPFEQHVNLAPGKYRLRIGVRDQRNNLIGTVLADVEVPPKN